MLKRARPEFDMANNRPQNPTEAPTAPGVGFQPMNGSAPAGGRPIPMMNK